MEWAVSPRGMFARTNASGGILRRYGKALQNTAFLLKYTKKEAHWTVEELLAGHDPVRYDSRGTAGGDAQVEPIQILPVLKAKVPPTNPRR
jgi:hypothetical protein